MKAALALVLMLNFAVALGAQTPPAAQVEIDYLLAGVDKSGCQFYRNGTWYSSGEARSHLSMKYEYLARSSLSGEPYQVRCNGQAATPSASWFAGELDRYRAGATPSPAYPGR
jgi:hypothetical protein